MNFAEAEKKLKAQAEEEGWLHYLIYDIGICNDNIW